MILLSTDPVPSSFDLLELTTRSNARETPFRVDFRRTPLSISSHRGLDDVTVGPTFRGAHVRGPESSVEDANVEGANFARTDFGFRDPTRRSPRRHHWRVAGDGVHALPRGSERSQRCGSADGGVCRYDHRRFPRQAGRRARFPPDAVGPERGFRVRRVPRICRRRRDGAQNLRPGGVVRGGRRALAVRGEASVRGEPHDAAGGHPT